MTNKYYKIWEIKNVNCVKQLVYYHLAYYEECYHFEDTNVHQRHSVL